MGQLRHSVENNNVKPDLSIHDDTDHAFTKQAIAAAAKGKSNIMGKQSGCFDLWTHKVSAKQAISSTYNRRNLLKDVNFVNVISDSPIIA